MGIYCDVFFPWLMEKAGNEPEEIIGKLRADTLKGLYGTVLDVGFGIGFNLLYYPEEVVSIVALEPSKGMCKRAERFVDRNTGTVQFVKETIENSTLKDSEFDCIVSTTTLCTVQNQSLSLKEIKRLLKPDGRFHFLEHVCSPDKNELRLQNIINPLNRLLLCGCNINRDTEKSINEAGFTLEEIERFQLDVPGWPKFMAHMIRGVGKRR